MNIVSLANYANNGDGFGLSTQQDLDSLNKALEAQHITGRDTEGASSPSGSPLKVESLEKNLKVLEFKESDIRLIRNVPTLSATNTVEEYNRLDSIGQERGGFNTEGELPEEEDATYSRHSQLVKYLGNTRVVTHPMTLVNTHTGNVIQRETRNGMLWVLRKANRALTNADADQIPVEFNSFYKQHQEGFSSIGDYIDNSELVIDLRGERLTEESLEEAARRIIDNYGSPDDFWSPPAVISGFTKSFYDTERKLINSMSNPLVAGMRFQTFASQFGNINLQYEKFMRRQSSRTTATAKDHDKAPNAPVGGGTPVAAVAPTVESSKFGASDAGDYFYAVAGVNRYGLSQLTSLNAAAVTVAANGAVDLQFVDGGGANAATAYVIFRADKDISGVTANTQFHPIFTISAAQLTTGYDGGGANTVRDMNRWLPKTEQSFMVENDVDIWSFKQLAPMMKMDLALLGPAYRFMILQYATPILYQPRKFIRFINIAAG